MNSVFRPVIWAALLVAWAVLTSCSGAAERQADYVASAQQYFDTGDLDKARVDVRNALQIDGNHAGARYLYALVLEREQNWNQVYANLKFAVELDPVLIPARIKLGELLLANRVFDKAMEHVEAVIEHQPQHAQAHALKAAIHHRMGEPDLAIAAAQEALSLEPGNIGAIGVLTDIYKNDNPAAALNLIEEGIAQQSRPAALKLLRASVHESHHDYASAEKVYQELLNEHPNNLYYYYRYILLMEADGRSDEAEALIRQVVQARPESQQLKIWLAQFLVDRKDLPAAERALLEYLGDQPDQVELRFALAQVYILQRKLEAAVGVYQRFVTEEHDSENAQRARNALARMALAEGDRPRAETLLAEIFEIEPNNVEALTSKARLAVADGHLEQAVSDLRLALKNDPTSVETLLVLARAQEASGATDVAIDRYREIIYNDPTNRAALLALTEHAIRREDYPAAAMLASIALRVDASNTEAARLLVTAYAKDGDFDQAIAQADSLAALRSTQVLGTYLLGRIYELQGNNKAAIIKMQQTLQLQPAVVEALRTLALLQQEESGLEAALQTLRGHLMQHPEHLHAMELLGQFSADAGDHAQARKWFEDVLEKDVSRATAYMLLGDLVLSQGNAEEAKVVYTRGLAQNTRNVPLMLRLGQVNELLGTYEEAARHYQTALTLASVPAAQNNLAMVYADHLATEENLQRALGLMRQHANSDNAAMLDTLGWVHYRAGEHRTALRYLRQAAELAGDVNPAIQYHLGMALSRNNQPTRARDALRKALEAGVDFRGVDEARRVLQELEGVPLASEA